jgi:hypothetical protein
MAERKFNSNLWTHYVLDKEDENAGDEAGEGSDFGENFGDDGEKKEYVKKEFFARPYISDGITEADVNNLIVKNTR